MWLKQSNYGVVLISVGSNPAVSWRKSSCPIQKAQGIVNRTFAIVPFFLITYHLRRTFEITVNCMMNAW